MTSGTGRPALVSDAIFVDEIGIEIGIYGNYRLKSSYQPIFARQGDLLRPVAVEGLISPFLSGKPVSAAAFFRSIPAEDRAFIESMCRALHLRNYRNIGQENIDLYFNYDLGCGCDPQSTLMEIARMALRLDEMGLEAPLLVCEIADGGAGDGDLLDRLATALRESGVAIAIDDFGAAHSTEERMDLIRPEVFKLDGPWFRKVCREPAAIRLLGQLVSGLQKRGAKVLVEGIEEPAQLTVALESGADLFQGYHLGRPALAGAIFDEAPRALGQLERQSNVVVPLFG